MSRKNFFDPGNSPPPSLLRNGDVVIACAHAFDRDTKTVHWWRYPDGQPIERPDGSSIVANWLMACLPCRDRAGRDAARIEVTQDGVFENGEIVVEPGAFDRPPLPPGEPS